MKQILLWCLLMMSSVFLLAQTGTDAPLVYPNPTEGYVQLENAATVRTLTVYNLVGRKLVSYPVVGGQKYDLTGLPPGMYLVRLQDAEQKIVGTRRVQKR